MPVEINEVLCGFCLGCATICPESLFYIENAALLIKEGCIDCGRCITCCPVEAISEI